MNSISAGASPAPIALFTYNRPEHTRRTLEALKANSLAAKSDLIVYSDGPKHESAREKVAATRALLADISGFRSVTRVFRDTNMGLARSIIAGVSDVVERCGSVIVLEDDLVASPHFLKYMNDALSCYAAEEKVACIHGYNFPMADKLPETFFVRGGDCWGWATWKRAWKVFQPDGRISLSELKRRKLTRQFDHDDTYPFTRMLSDQIKGRNDSWAVRWHVSIFLAEKLTLYPGKTLVKNIGNDGEGTHCGDNSHFDGEPTAHEVVVGGITIRESETAFRAFSTFYKELYPKTPFLKKVLRKLNLGKQT